MTGLIDMAAAIMSGAERRLEIAGANVANISTPGYKQLRIQRVPGSSGNFAATLDRIEARLTQGSLVSTGRKLDLAVAGEGYLAVRDGESIAYVRNGQFQRSSDGTLLSLQGGVLQQAGGGDLVVSVDNPEIGDDGTVVEQGRPTGRIGLFTTAVGEAVTSVDGARFLLGATPQDARGAGVRQGFLETSNVDTGEQMISMMSALRESETGAKLVQTYDDLLGKAFATLGQAGR